MGMRLFLALCHRCWHHKRALWTFTVGFSQVRASPECGEVHIWQSGGRATAWGWLEAGGGTWVSKEAKCVRDRLQGP